MGLNPSARDRISLEERTERRYGQIDSGGLCFIADQAAIVNTAAIATQEPFKVATPTCCSATHFYIDSDKKGFLPNNDVSVT